MIRAVSKAWDQMTRKEESMSTDTAPATTKETAIAPKAATASGLLAGLLKLDPAMMVRTIKSQCFKVNADKITDEMMAAYINVALALREQCPNFNPLLPGMLYAFPGKNGEVVPMIGPDGVFAMLAGRPDIDHWNTECDFDTHGNPISVTARIYCNDRSKPFEKTCYLSEWKVSSNPNWGSRPSHMLELRAIKQCARQIIFGVPMDREEMEIIEVEAKDTATGLPAAPPAKGRLKPAAKPAASPAQTATVTAPSNAEPARGEPETDNGDGTGEPKDPNENDIF